MTIRTPNNTSEWAAYYELRWYELRRPWKQPRGSEKDSLDDTAIHLAAFEEDEIIAIGRLHFEEQKGWIRFMATHSEHQKKGIASKVLGRLEAKAQMENYNQLALQARESAVPFYEKNGFLITQKSHILFGEVQHFLMAKELH